MQRFAFLVALSFALPFAAAAQRLPQYELFGGYTYTRVYNTNGDSSSSNGGTGDVAVYPLRWLGFVADLGYSYSNGFTQSGTGTFVTAPTHSLHYFGGVRFRLNGKRITPYVEGLFGAVHRSQLLTSTGTLLANPQTSLAYFVGGGVDVKVVRHFSIRVVQAGYLLTSFHPLSGTQHAQNDFSIATGIVIH